MARKNQTDSNLAAKGFLAASALGALNTANAIKPAARKGPVSVLSFFPGWLTSELPLHVIGWQALATAGFVRAGALRSPKGWAALGLSAASWTALCKTWLQSLEAGDIYAKALRDGLGDDLVTEVLPTPESDPKLVRRRIAAGPMQNWRKRYVSPGDRDLSYGDAGRRNQLDIWKSPDIEPGSKAPVLVQVHGGGWIIGNKQQQAMPMLAHLADQGWVCVSINYRLSPRATWPDHIVDVKRALAWVKTNIADYGGDPDFVCITGGSAGGHLSSLAALTPNEPMFQPGFEDADTSVAAAVPFYGVYDWINRDGSGRSDMDDVLGPLVLKVTQQEDPELWYNASTMSWVSPDAPPFFVIHGANDSLVPVEQARSFVAMLRAESKEPVVYAELPGAQHGFEIFDSQRTLATVTAVHRFLESVRRSADHSGINSNATP